MRTTELPDNPRLVHYEELDIPVIYYCPVCGAELYEADPVYCEGRDVLGCDKCLDKREAGEMLHGTH